MPVLKALFSDSLLTNPFNPLVGSGVLDSFAQEIADLAADSFRP
jgi:hypothetical protein